MTTTPLKKVQLVLVYYTNLYVVKSITNTTHYKPGDHLTPEVAQKCCDIPNWDVTMIDNEILATIINKLPTPAI